MHHSSEIETSYQTGRRLFQEGVHEFREGGFFEAHDLWEDFWHELRGPDRLFLQGLIHLAVGTYHFESGNMRGAKSQLHKAITKLEPYPEHHWGIDTRAWLMWARQLLEQESTENHPDGIVFDESQFPPELKMAPR